MTCRRSGKEGSFESSSHILSFADSKLSFARHVFIQCIDFRREKANFNAIRKQFISVRLWQWRVRVSFVASSPLTARVKPPPCPLHTDAILLANNSQHCWIVQVASVCHPVACCCVLLRVVVQSLKPVKHLATCKRTQQCWANHVGSCWPTTLRPSARGLIRIIPTICYNQANKVTSVKWVGCIICDFLFVLLLLNRRIISNFVGFRKSLSAASVSWSNGGSVAVVSSFSSTCISWVWNSVVEKE